MSKENHTIAYDEKPWGLHAVLSDAGHYKVKELIVFPGQRLSYQLHYHRTEHWQVLEGKGVVTLNGVEQVMEVADTIWIPSETAHRLANHGDEPLVVLEVQYLEGDELSEEDIVRLEDDYDRVSAG